MNRNIPILLGWLAALLWTESIHAQDLSVRSPFGISVTPGNSALRVDFTVPTNCVINQNRLHFRTSDGTEIEPRQMPPPEWEINQSTGKTNLVYPRNFSAEINPADLPDHELAVKFQGCTNGECYFPEQRLFAPRADGSYGEVTAGAPAAATTGTIAGAVDWNAAFRGFKVEGQQTGFLAANEFIDFLGQALAGKAGSDPLAQFKHLGLPATLFLIVAGGFLLNFTPCILPMIPINLAIIGAGRAARSRWDGFGSGLVYGLGIALAYGTLGLVVVLTGSKFGTLNSNFWFNAAIALVFVVMAMGMFDVLAIDLSRFSGTGPAGTAGRGALTQHAVVLFMGVMSSLLAGACVAPVVISVVLLATDLYAKGVVAGLTLPFLLGAGMALPWPFAGAGLTFLPKPGAWMKYIKHGFGVMILGFALYYGHLAWHAHQAGTMLAAATTTGQTPAEGETQMLAALQTSRATGRPLFVDFHASWCKDCSAMDSLVFNRPEVQKELENFVTVRYAAEQPNASPAKPLLDYFHIVGLPTYLVLSPKHP